MIKQIIGIAILALASGMTYAQNSLDISKLTKEQAAELASKAKEFSEENKSPVVTAEKVRTEVGEWGKMGANIGEAVIAAASQIGVAANEFVKTPLGKVTTAIVVYKIIGKDVIKIAFGTIVFTICIMFSIFYARNGREIKYETKERTILWGLFTYDKHIKVSQGSIDGEYATVSVITGIVGLLVAAISIFA